MRRIALTLLVMVAGCAGGEEGTRGEEGIYYSATVTEVSMPPDDSDEPWTCSHAITVGGVSPDRSMSWVWESGSLEWRHLERDTPLRPPLELDTGDLLRFWGTDRLLVGETLTTDRVASHTEPFMAVYTFHSVLPDSSRVNSTVSVGCNWIALLPPQQPDALERGLPSAQEKRLFDRETELTDLNGLAEGGHCPYVSGTPEMVGSLTRDRDDLGVGEDTA